MPRPLSLAGLLAIVLIAPATASAGAIVTYQFTNHTGGPVSRADFTVVPPGTVLPPVVGTDSETGSPITASPVTLDPSRSSGFDVNNFSTALGTGATVQGLRLLFGQKQVVQDGKIVFDPVFGPDGQAPRYLDDGGTVTFNLNLDPAFQGMLQLHSLTAGIADPILVATLGGDDDGGNGGTDPNGTPPSVPEPVSLAVWSAMTGLGLAGARLRGRRRAA